MSRKPSASTLSPEYVVLGLLNLQPAHGYDLHERITRELGQIWHISLSQTYNILNRLEGQSYITGAIQERDKSPACRRFRLTSAGRRHFEAWLNVPTKPSAHAIRVEFLTRLYFTYMAAPDNVDTLIGAQIAETQADLTHLQAMLADLPEDQLFNHLGLELRVCQLTSVLDWLADCRKRFATKSEP